MTSAHSSDSSQARALIPGAYERNTVTRRQAGSMSGPAYGSDDVPTGPSLLDAATIAEREKEGGGGVGERRPVKRSTDRPTHGGSWLHFWRFLRT